MRIFLSHSSADTTYCAALVHAMREAGADVWYDADNLGAGRLLDDIMRELRARPAFVVMLSKRAFRSKWVGRECRWAFNLFDREPNRIILPVVAAPIEQRDFDKMLFLEDFRRIEAPHHQPLPVPLAIEHTLRLLALTPKGKQPPPTTPQPDETTDDLIAHGKALNAQKQFAQALAYFERATQNAPANESAWLNLGYTIGELKRHDEALPAFNHVLKLNPQNATAWNNKGVALRTLHRFQQALAAFKHATKIDAAYATAWDNMGLALYDLRRYAQALEQFDHTLSLDATNAAVWNNKGNALNMLKRYDEALAAYDEALRRDPRYASASNNRADVLLKQERYDDALAASDRAISLDPSNAVSWTTKGEVLSATMRMDDALLCFDRALALDASDRFAWLGKAAALRALGNDAEAANADEHARSLG